MVYLSYVIDKERVGFMMCFGGDVVCLRGWCYEEKNFVGIYCLFIQIFLLPLQSLIVCRQNCFWCEKRSVLRILLVLFISCSTQKKSENVANVSRAEVKEGCVENEVEDEIEVVYLTPDANSVAIGLLTDSVSLAAEGDSVVVKNTKADMVVGWF